MKKYNLLFEDKQGNELQRKQIEAFNIKQAREIRDKIFNSSLINDLHKITVKSI